MAASAMTIRETPAVLGVGIGEIAGMIEGRSLAVLEVDGHQLVPRFQFSDDRLVPSFGEIYRLNDPNLPRLTFYRWFILPSLGLPSASEARDLSPKEGLNANLDPNALYLAAKCLPGGWWFSARSGSWGLHFARPASRGSGCWRPARRLGGF